MSEMAADETIRRQTDAMEAIDQARAWLARAEERRDAERGSLAREPVRRLRTMAAMMGVRGTRTMRKSELVKALVPVRSAVQQTGSAPA